MKLKKNIFFYNYYVKSFDIINEYIPIDNNISIGKNYNEIQISKMMKHDIDTITKPPTDIKSIISLSISQRKSLNDSF